jgi:hypothetical protein
LWWQAWKAASFSGISGAAAGKGLGLILVAAHKHTFAWHKWSQLSDATGARAQFIYLSRENQDCCRFCVESPLYNACHLA